MKPIIVIGITGGIAAVKTPELVANLVHHGYDVRVIMTRSTTHIVSPDVLTQASGHPVLIELFDASFSPSDILKKRSVDHITLANNAKLFVIVPATANVIAKIAAGIADDYVTTTALAATCPILVCPSMNVFMWKNPATQKNIATLHELGIHTFGPDDGMLACGYTGAGRLPSIDAIENEIMRFMNITKSLQGKRVIITAGGTVEPIDDVRVITNRSSGKMGVALAESCFLRGADVLLLRSKTSVQSRYAIREEVFETANDLKRLMESHLPTCDIVIHAAAVSDFSVKRPVKGKSSSDHPLSLELEPQTKILDRIKKINPHVILVAFKAEYALTQDQMVEIARKRLRVAHADIIIANDLAKSDRGVESDYNEVYIIDKKGASTHLPCAPKTQIADAIMEYVVKNVMMGSASR